MPEINVDRLVSTFCELVKVPSESPNDKEFISHLESLFKMLGAKTAKDSYGNLIAKFNAKNSKNTTPVAFAVHADTVKPGIGIDPFVDGGKIRSKGDTILGCDDKGGIAEIIEMIRTAEKYPPLEIIATRCEEIGCFGSVNLDYSMINSKIAYVLDGEEIDDITVGGPTIICMDVDYKGKSSHAGMAPEKGISSIVAAAKAVSRLKLGKLDEETTANVGVFQGGEIRNGIPEKTNILAECRCMIHEKGMKVADEMEKIFKEAAKENGTEITVNRELSLKAYYLSEDLPVVKMAISALKENGVKPKVVTVRGGSDATHLNSHGINAAVLGIGVREAHTSDEYAIIDEMTTMTRVIKTIVEGLA